MAINFTRLFTSLGKIIASVNSVNTYRGTTLPARVAVLDAQYVNPIQEVIDDLYTQQLDAQNSSDTWMGYLQTLAEATIQKEVNLDRPMPNPSLPEAITQVARGLRLAGETVTNSPVVLSNTPTLTVGNARLTYSESINQSDLYLVDVLNVTVSSDQTTGSTAFSEFLTVQGKANVDPLNWLWPQGSNVSGGLASTDSAFDTLVSSDFSTWTTSGTGVAAADNPRSSLYATQTCWQLTGNGSYVQYPLTALAPGSFPWTLFYKGDAGNTAGTTLIVRLVDASGATVATLATLTGLTGTWIQTSDMWNYTINPPITPGALYLRIIVSTGGTGVMKIAFPGFTQASPVYSGGPVLFCWSGTTPLGLADYWTATSTRAASETVSLYRGMERLFGLSSLSPYIAIPTASPGTYTNALVV